MRSYSSPGSAVPLYVSAGIDISGIGEAPVNAVSLHTPAEFDAFLTDVVVNQPTARNLCGRRRISAHTPVRVNKSLQTHRTVHTGNLPQLFTWLAQIEQWCPRSSATSMLACADFRRRSEEKNSCATSVTAKRATQDGE